MKYSILFLFLLFSFCNFEVNAQNKPIVVENADNFDVDELQMPDAVLLTGNVLVRHEGATLRCNKAYFFKKENYIKAFGAVVLNQGDTLHLNSDYAEYAGNLKQAFATGNPILRSPEFTLTTDTINFDRNIQQAYYKNYGKIVNKETTLTSKSGRYFANEKKFRFLTAVTVTNPKVVIKSNHLDYYFNSGHSYLLGASTVTSKEDFIYTEKGFYDTKKNIAHFLRKSYIKYRDRKIDGDSLYYDKNREFASASHYVKITDTINKGVVRGHYAELYKAKDSMFVTRKAVAVSLMENDSVYIHGTRLMLTGKPENRIIRAFKNARFFKSDMNGKCDSIHSSTKVGLTKLIGRPIIWNKKNQVTGDVIHLIADLETEKIDSLKVLNNAFIISKDTIGTGYNQVKGLNLYGKFKDDKLNDVTLVKNTEILYFMRDDKDELIGINKSVSSKINLILEDSKIETITQYDRPEGQMYPEKELPENARRLRGFIWREDEMIKNKDDVFPEDELKWDEIARKYREKAEKLADKPIAVRKETSEYDKNVKKGK
ncbi:OstA-like protein [Flavobacterium sp.]|uniref:OstA-like protein n=1 Tax=Flavobacterium sp. TaxID=239 RepID=UPI0026384F7C|nr:OstA-like protein [Flavobacterium sp.]